MRPRTEAAGGRCAVPHLSPPVLFLIGMALAIGVWFSPSKGPHVAITGGMCLLALFRRARLSAAWRSPAGLAFIAFALYILVSLPFSSDVSLSTRSLVKLLLPIATALAIPVLFDTPRRIKWALLCSASAITFILAVDLGRLSLQLGSTLPQLGRFTRPYVLNHPNVASLLAGAAAIIFAFLGPAAKPRLGRTLCAVGILVDLLYVLFLASRGPQASLALSVVVAGVVLPGWRKKAVWFLVILAGFAVVAANIDKINPRFRDPDVWSLNGRDIVWRHTWELSKEKPVLGHGFGKKVFRRIYYESKPPPSPFYYPHAHSHWLKLLFEAGWVGVGLNAAGWLLLVAHLLKVLHGRASLTDRLLPAALLALTALVHAYGIVDYPDQLVRIMQIWLVPVSLTIPCATRAPGESNPQSSLPYGQCR